MQVLPGFLAVHPVALRRSSDPGRPCRASPWRHHRCCPQLVETEGTIGILYRGSITPLHHPLCTLRDVRCRTPRNTRSRLVGCTFTGQESNLLDCGEWFPLFHKHPPFQDFAWRNDNDVERTTKRIDWTRVASLPGPLVGGIMAMMFLNGLACMPFQTFLSAYLIGQVGLEETHAASAWGIIGLVGMFSGLVMGALADRITVRRGMIVTCLVLGMAAAAIVFVETGGMRYLLIHLAAAAFGLSFYAIFGLVPAYISHLFSGGNAALVFAFGNVALGIGGVIGNLVGGYSKEITGSFDMLYLMILAASLLSAFIAMAMPGEIENGLGNYAPTGQARGFDGKHDR